MSRPPRWYAIPVRVLLLTFIGTLLSFAISLLLGILGAIIFSAIRGQHADMRLAYRDIALPTAAVAGAIIFIAALVTEIRHYRRAKTLSAIERMA